MKLIWSRAAEADMDSVWHFLAQRNVAFAERAEAIIRASVGRLVEFPLLGRVRPGGGRELSLPQIQFRVGYYVFEDDRILIATIRSTREGA